MAVEIRWHIPQRVIYTRFHGKVTLEDITNSTVQAHKLVAEGIPFVHTLIEVQDVTGYPSLVDLRKIVAPESSEKEGWQIIIGAEGMPRFIGSILVQIIGKRYRMVDTRDEALAFLTEQDESLDLTNAERG